MDANPATLYRGVTDFAAHKLRPKVGRNAPLDAPNLTILETFMLRKFQRLATARLSQRPQNLWQWLALAQHYGLPTRMLDWTFNPLVAAFFACRGPDTSHGAIYLLSEFNDLEKVNEEDSRGPFEIAQVSEYHPAHFTPRLTAQNGAFTVHPNPTRDWESSSVRVLLVSGGSKRDIADALEKRGFTEGAMYPELEGLGRQLAQETDRRVAMLGTKESE